MKQLHDLTRHDITTTSTTIINIATINQNNSTRWTKKVSPEFLLLMLSTLYCVWNQWYSQER